MWIKPDTKPDEMRGDIETRNEFVSRNIHWWWINRRHERIRRKEYYDRFLSFGNIQTDNLSRVAEVGPGPFGGMIEVCGLDVGQKVFIDYIMEDLFNLKFIAWPEDATYVHAPAEKIPLEDNYCDILLSYNTLDHGWNTKAAVLECIRVSKRCYLAFDCRGDSEEEVAVRQVKPDKDHYQLLKYKDMASFIMGLNMMNDSIKLSIEDMDFKKFPVAFVKAEKC